MAELMILAPRWLALPHNDQKTGETVIFVLKRALEHYLQGHDASQTLAIPMSYILEKAQSTHRQVTNEVIEAVISVFCIFGWSIIRRTREDCGDCLLFGQGWPIDKQNVIVYDPAWDETNGNRHELQSG